ncbi:MAG: hypothetical protein AB3X44_06540 [Leptothrix sp. (in: b-proteobacteria)]
MLPETMVIAEMITHDFIWRGAGANCDEAREALLTWAKHRAAVVQQQPALAATLPEAGRMQQHFKIRYSEYTRGAGYRDDDRLV